MTKHYLVSDKASVKFDEKKLVDYWHSLPEDKKHYIREFDERIFEKNHYTYEVLPSGDLKIITENWTQYH